MHTCYIYIYIYIFVYIILQYRLYLYLLVFYVYIHRSRNSVGPLWSEPQRPSGGRGKPGHGMQEDPELKPKA